MGIIMTDVTQTRPVQKTVGGVTFEDLLANAGGRPIHLCAWRNTSHGIVDPVVSAAYYAGWLAFVMDQLGITASQR
jgi:hypothetical protein